MLKQIREYLFLRKQAKRLQTLERISHMIQSSRFTLELAPSFLYTDATPLDVQIAQGIMDELITELTEKFKSDYQLYIDEQIKILDNE